MTSFRIRKNEMDKREFVLDNLEDLCLVVRMSQSVCLEGQAYLLGPVCVKGVPPSMLVVGLRVKAEPTQVASLASGRY